MSKVLKVTTDSGVTEVNMHDNAALELDGGHLICAGEDKAVVYAPGHWNDAVLEEKPDE